MREKIVALAALMLGGLASVCCLGPLVLVGLGIGGAGAFASFSKFRPLFLALTAVLLAVAFYLAYRKREVACADGSCELRSASKKMKVAVWLIAIFAAGLSAFLQWAGLFSSNPSLAVSTDAQEIKLAVSGMFCAGCATGIAKALKQVPGVQSVSVDFDKSEAVVRIKQGTVSKEELLKAVQSAGPYKVQFLGE